MGSLRHYFSTQAELLRFAMQLWATGPGPGSARCDRRPTPPDR
ncbi:MAG TPA: hypothetical protein VHM23_00105 [Actinomycetota bacterium]|jgi:hypothetical protein|nr:hypothetical protein [Actinomycetota bacterium]